MPGFMPGIHVLTTSQHGKDVDASRGHSDAKTKRSRNAFRAGPTVEFQRGDERMEETVPPILAPH